MRLQGGEAQGVLIPGPGEGLRASRVGGRRAGGRGEGVPRRMPGDPGLGQIGKGLSWQAEDWLTFPQGSRKSKEAYKQVDFVKSTRAWLSLSTNMQRARQQSHWGVSLCGCSVGGGSPLPPQEGQVGRITLGLADTLGGHGGWEAAEAGRCAWKTGKGYAREGMGSAARRGGC